MTHSIASGPSAHSDLARELGAKVRSGQLELPVLSQTALEVAELCRQGAADARALAATLNRDPALAGHVLRVANSAAYAPIEPVVSLQQAVSRMGLATVGQIAFAIAVGSRVFHVPGHEPWVREMWRHAAQTAGWAREIARAKRANVERAFLAGLLHDVGEPLLLQAAVDRLGVGARDAGRAELTPLLDALHAEAGAALARAWKLAPWIAEAIEHHHAPAAAHDGEGAALVQLADELATRLDSEQAACVSSAPAELGGAECVERLGLYPQEFEALLARAGAVRDFAGAMR